MGRFSTRGAVDWVLRFVTPWRRWLAKAAEWLRDPMVWRAACPLLIPIIFAPWLYIALKNYRGAALFRDVNMFNYAAWCFLKGERIYDSITTPDGPFVYVLHSALLLLAGGTREQMFRHVDVIVQVCGSGAMGVLLVPRGARLRWVHRGVWALVTIAVWLARVVQSDFSSSVQREGYYVLLGSLGMCLVYASWQYSTRVARAMLASGALLAGWMMFGKQTGVMYVAFVLLIALLLPRDPVQTCRWRLKWIGLGVGAAVVTMLGLVVVRGSLRGLYTWYFEFVFEYYRYWEVARAQLILVHGDRSVYFTPAIAALLAGGAAVAVGALPARALAFAIAPFANMVAAIAQMKGWPYQFVPILLSAYLFLVVALVAAWVPATEETPAASGRSVAIIGLMALVALRCGEELQHAKWLQEGEKHLDDPEVVQAHDAAHFLSEHTGPSERVLYYGNDPGVPFFAQRLPAIPTLQVMMLNFKEALENHDPKTEMTPAERARAFALQARIQADACKRIVMNDPAAMVLTDHTAAGGADAVNDFKSFCPPFGPMLADHYRLRKTIGAVRIYLRNDHP